MYVAIGRQIARKPSLRHSLRPSLPPSLPPYLNNKWYDMYPQTRQCLGSGEGGREDGLPLQPWGEEG